MKSRSLLALCPLLLAVYFAAMLGGCVDGGGDRPIEREIGTGENFPTGRLHLLDVDGARFLLWEWSNCSAMCELTSASTLTLEDIRWEEINTPPRLSGRLYKIIAGQEKFLLYEWSDNAAMRPFPD